MHGYNHTPSKDIEGWSGIFTEIKDWSTIRHNGLPNAVHGMIKLYPNRKSRILRCREIGWFELDLYFRTYNTEKIKGLLKTKIGRSYYFNGEIKDRTVYQGSEFPDLCYELELEDWWLDRSQGRYSLLQAHTTCSDFSELHEW